MIRFCTIGLCLALAACAPPERLKQATDAAVMTEPAPKAQRTAPVDICDTPDDGIGGTGCKEP